MSSRLLETRNRILRATLDLLVTGNGNEVRMSDIAKRAKISRQAVYLHFASRAELLVATTLYLDELKGADERLATSRAAKTGVERLDAYIDAWGNYIPEIYRVIKAILAMSDTDEEAAKAWDARMSDLKEGCQAAIKALAKDNMLSPALTPQQATDLFWTLLSVRNWELLTIECGWSQENYITTLKATAQRIFVSG